MIADFPRPPGSVTSRDGESNADWQSKRLPPSSRVFPLPAASRFSPNAQLFASAAVAAGEYNRSAKRSTPACRSRVRVWETSNGGGAADTSQLTNSCIAAGEEATGAPARSRCLESERRAVEVEWSRQFLGHNVNAVLFVPKREVISALSPLHEDSSSSSYDNNSSEAESEDDATLLIGTDKGMVAAADVSGRCGSKLLYAVYLGDAQADGAGKDGEASTTGFFNLNHVTGGSWDSTPAPGIAAAAAGVFKSTASAVYDLRALPRRSDAALALVGCPNGSTLYLINVKDGSVLQQETLSKCYTLMATASRLPWPACSVDLQTSHTHTQLSQVALLGCGGIGKGDVETELDQSRRSGVLLLYDISQRRQLAKFMGASGDCCRSLALQDGLHFAAAAFSSSARQQQQTQLLVWQVPSKTIRLLEEGATAAKRKKLHPIAMTHYYESLLQLLLLPVTRSGVEERRDSLNGEVPMHNDGKSPTQLLVGLSRSSVIAVWGCYNVGAADSTRFSSCTLELLLQIDTAAPTCALPSAQSKRMCAGQHAFAAAVATPGVWYIEEGISCSTWGEEYKGTGECKLVTAAKSKETPRGGKQQCEDSSAADHLQKTLTLRVARGSYAAPMFTSVILPTLSDMAAAAGTKLQLYLPLLPSSSSDSRLYGGVCSVIKPLSAEDVKKTIRNVITQRKGDTGGSGDRGGSQGFEHQVSIFAESAAHDTPTASLKRKIGAACSSGGTAAGEVAESRKGGDTKNRKIAKFPSLLQKMEGTDVGKSNVASVLRQALAASDARLLESVLSTTAKDKKEVTAAVASLTPARGLLLLQHLVQQQQTCPATSILKGPWIEELVKQHGVILGSTEAGREQLVLLLLQVEERRRAEAALVRVKGRVELLLQQIQRIEKQKEQRRTDEIEVREPLVVHQEYSQS